MCICFLKAWDASGEQRDYFGSKMGCIQQWYANLLCYDLMVVIMDMG